MQEFGRTRVECNVKIKSTYGAKLFALGTIVRIPVPKQTAKAHITVRMLFCPSCYGSCSESKEFQ